jgi:SEC-C motif-containing protein
VSSGDAREACPCGSTLSLARCCGPLLSGECAAVTAEQLMRSRYTAYVKHDTAYLQHTWHPDTRPGHLVLDAQPAPRWTGLNILRTAAGLADDSSGTVEFEARYKLNGRACRLHEVSRFVQRDGRWYYLDGDVAQ